MRRTRMVAAALLVLAAAGCDGRRAHVVTGDLRGLEHAVLELVSGAETITVRNADPDVTGYRVATPRGAAGVPAVTERDGVVSAALTGSAPVEILLSDDVRWTVRIAGGAREQLVDLGAGPIGDVELRGGADRITVGLPAGDGTTTVRMSGGASTFDVLAPAAVPVRVSLAGGAGSARVDGETRSGIAGGTVFGPADWDTAADRYDIQALAGVSGFTLDRR
ncbi:hypothetical protein J2S43_004887 [Catenuloplanes nepalensis]|uniref:Uncharacterized protein n=1 Tax=Catenuloplanes nepalensis TaxID=587533 RepID=A0ABT9MY68_9ACTN|nr:hypothetical protein [Catenuloplanes nepalensis]MDP9796375.1 hypothetical protein [Catenuloplanes nepalensis]